MAKTRKVLKAENSQLVARNQGLVTRETEWNTTREKLNAKLAAAQQTAKDVTTALQVASDNLVKLQAQAKLTCESAHKPDMQGLHDELARLEALLPKAAPVETATEAQAA